MEPLITLPIAAYNTRPEHLAAAIASALQQSYRNLEVIVSDDSPTPALQSIVESFNDPRVRYRHNVPGLGVAGNHWKCFREARGEFIAVLNHDDTFEPAFLQRLTAPLLADPELALAFCDHWVIDAEGQRQLEASEQTSAAWGRSALQPGPHRPFHNLLAAQTIPMVMAAVFRRSLLPAELLVIAGPAYDLWLTYWLCRTGRGAHYIDERLSSWRAHPTNITSTGNTAWSLGAATCWEQIARDPQLQPIHKLAREKAAISFSASAVSAWRKNQRGACFKYALKSLGMKWTKKGFVACLLPIVP